MTDINYIWREEIKKFLMLLLALAIISAGMLLGGCGKADSGQQASQTAPAKEESVTDILGKAKTIAGLSYDYLVTPKMDTNVAYSVNPATGTALKIPRDRGKTVDTPDRYTKDLDAGKLKTQETTVYEGVKCRVIITQDPQNKVQTKM